MLRTDGQRTYEGLGLLGRFFEVLGSGPGSANGSCLRGASKNIPKPLLFSRSLGGRIGGRSDWDRNRSRDGRGGCSFTMGARLRGDLGRLAVDGHWRSFGESLADLAGFGFSGDPGLDINESGFEGGESYGRYSEREEGPALVGDAARDEG